MSRSKRTRGVTLSPEDRAHLEAMINVRGANRMVGAVGVDPRTVQRALAGLPCHRSTIELLRVKLGRDGSR